MVDEKTQKLLDKVNASIVNVITKGLEEGVISQERAQKIAQMVIEKLPEDISYEELIRIIPKLDDEFKELSDAIIPIMLEYETKMKEVINQRISALLKQQKFKEALEIARKAIDFEKNLS